MTTTLFSDIGAGLLLGLLGSLHCIGMCGGIAGALQMTSPGKYPPVLNALLFNAGRIIGYAVMAALVALVLSLGLRGLPAVPMVMRLIAGVMLILMGIYVGGWLKASRWNPLTRLEQLGGMLWKHLLPIQRKLIHNPAIPARLLVGFIWGWLPCGLVYSTLAWAIATQDPATAALRMSSFGLGTLPALIATGVFAAQVQRQLQKRQMRQLAGVLLVMFGVWTFITPHIHMLMGHGAQSESAPAHHH